MRVWLMNDIQSPDLPCKDVVDVIIAKNFNRVDEYIQIQILEVS